MIRILVRCETLAEPSKTAAWRNCGIGRAACQLVEGGLVPPQSITPKRHASPIRAVRIQGLQRGKRVVALFLSTNSTMAQELVTLECTEAKKEGKPTSRYLTFRNKKTVTERIEKKKYNPFLKRHTVHKEIK